MKPEELSVQSIRQRIKENLTQHELALTADAGRAHVHDHPPSYSGSAFRRRLIALGLRHKNWIKRTPLLSSVATRVYCSLLRTPASPDLSLSLRVKVFVRSIPVLGFIAWWALSVLKAPTRIAHLWDSLPILRNEMLGSDAALRQEISNTGNRVAAESDIKIDTLAREMGGQLALIGQEIQNLGAQVSTQIDTAHDRIVRETLEAADSHTGPKAREGLWFNEPIKVQYDEAGHPGWSGATERIIEKAWVLRHMSDIAPDARILDVGCAESTLPIELASNGFQVTGIDIRPYPLEHPGFRFVQTDICSPALAPESYEVVVALSTIEHLGLGWYGDSQDESSDHVAMQQIYRLLSPGGLLLMTVPYGQRAMTAVHRIYDSESLQTLLEKFEIQNAEYGMKMDDMTWISPVPEERAAQQRHDPASGAPSAVCLIRCTKL